jgi:hypothetical protein
MSDTNDTPQPAPLAMQSGSVIVRATVHVTRKATGLVETYQLEGRIPAADLQPEPKEA